MKHFLVITTLVLLLLASGCTKSQLDTAAPSIELYTPTTTEIFATNEDIPFSALFADNNNLSEFTIIIQNLDVSLQNAWDTTFTKNISGSASVVDMAINIPFKVQGGDYRLQVVCNDKLNNSSDANNTFFKLESAFDVVYPTIDIIAPLPVNGQVVPLGENIVFLGQASDNMELHRLVIAIYYEDSGELYRPKSTMNISGNTLYDIAEYIKVPTKSGLYNVILTVSDMVNNQSTWEIPMRVLD